MSTMHYFEGRRAILRSVFLVLALASSAVALAPVATAQAADRYVSPTATGESENCLNPAAPCSLQAALAAGNSADGDTILLAPGTYEEAVAKPEIVHSVTISGEPGEPAPVLVPKVALGAKGFVSHQSVTLRDLRIHSPKNITAGFELAGSENVVERVESTGGAFAACFIDSGTIKDSLCQTAASYGLGTGVQANFRSASPEVASLQVSNVTAIGTLYGLAAGSEESGDLEVHVDNTVASGGPYDVRNGDEASSVTNVVISHSNFGTSKHFGSGSGSITPNTEAGNQSASPVFVDEAAGDYREMPTSPTVRAGDTSVLTPGELDLDGSERTTACEGVDYVDIGAYELGACP
jgi:hypothetical protein